MGYSTEALTRVAMKKFRGLSEMEFFEKWRAWYPEIKELHRQKDRDRYHANVPLSRQKQRESYSRNAEQRRIDARNQRAAIKFDPVRLEAHRKYFREKARIKAKTDANWLMKKRMRTRILMALKFRKKAATTADLIGCSLDELRAHIEKQFKPGMTWENCGRYGWHVDHIVPCSKFDLTDPEQQRKCFHFSNLQPLWWHENLSKGDN